MITRSSDLEPHYTPAGQTVAPPDTEPHRPDTGLVRGLDGLRAIAVSLVVFYHFGVAYAPGGYGVVLFFVLSGFLITRLLLGEFRKDGTVSLRNFYIRRALRIFPAFYAYWILVVLALLATGRHVPWGHAASAFVYVSNYYNAILGDPNTGFSHTWSLAIEEQFYLLWPLCLLWMLRQRANALALVCCTVALLWIYRIVLTTVFSVDQGYVYAAFDTRADALLVGCTLAIALHDRGTHDAIARVVRHDWIAAVAIALAVAVIATGYRVEGRFRDTTGLLMVPPLFALLLSHIASAPTGLLVRALDTRAMVYLGRISYPMYLYQEVAIDPAKRIAAGLPPLARLLFVYGVVVALASLSYFVIERPFLSLKTRFSPGGSGQARR
jgi:peptidoglycan/LPS O-acetylase OafA/YrhL